MTAKLKIVCVDDQDDILTYYSDLFEETDYEVVSFTHPEHAVDFINENVSSILFILSDFSMPEFDGFELRNRIFEKASEIPFALVTAFYDKDMAIKGMDLGVCSFIQKPFNEAEIFELIDKHGSKRKKHLEEEHEMVSSFVEESYPMLEEIEDLILVLEDDPQDIQALNTYFRLLHTIKGTASCVGLKTMPDYAHKYEDLVGLLKDGKQIVNRAVIDTLLAGLDQLKYMYEQIRTGEEYEFDISESVKIFTKDFSSTEDEKFEVSKEVDEKKKAKAASKVEEDKINVGVSILDEFMELSGELTVIRNTIVKSAAKIDQKYVGDKDVEVLNESLEEMHKVSSVLQNQISEMRKVSMETLLRPLKRVVRDASKSLGKEIHFTTIGDSLRIDTSIAKVLNGALVHLIRNGVDHGIESPDVREEHGKDRKGHLELTCFEDTENIIVEIIDDGNGMSVDRIKAKALEKELFTEEQLNLMSDQKIYSLIFESGFSTAAQVTDISGRGVGMDMVRSSVENIGGKILVDSEYGKGSKFVLILPIPRSVLIIKSLMVESKGQFFCLPLDDVGEVIRREDGINSDSISNIEGSLIIKHHDELIPLVDLGRQLGIGDYDSVDFNIVIIRGDGFKYGLMVDEIHDIEEVVCKKMAVQLQQMGCFQGATFVGDGEMSLILDLEGFANRADIAIDQSNPSDDYFSNADHEKMESKEYMQFDFSEKENYAIPLSEVNRLEEIDSNLVEFTGSIPIVKYRDGTLPIIHLEKLLSFSDGNFESYVKDIDYLKVIVISKGDKNFGFLVDKINDIGISFSEVSSATIDRDGINGTIFIEDKIISLVDVEYVIENYRGIHLPVDQVA